MSAHEYWLTQSILSDWLYCVDRDDRAELIRRLMRLRKESTTAMQRGLDFEALVTKWASSRGVPAGIAERPEAEIDAIRKFGNLCRGGVDQVPLTGTLTAGGMSFRLYGIADYVKAGRIFDIKRVSRYEYGKYQFSPQHPMYFYLLPEAFRFDYLIFDGSRWYIESYRRGDFKPIEQIAGEFVRYLRDSGTMETYMEHWAMNDERMEKINGIYCKKAR